MSPVRFRKGHLADFVDKQRAAVGHLEQPELASAEKTIGCYSNYKAIAAPQKDTQTQFPAKNSSIASTKSDLCLMAFDLLVGESQGEP